MPVTPTSSSYTQTVNVPAGGNLQSAINSASGGTRILLAPGATYVGPFTLPSRGDNGWVSIETNISAPSGSRVDSTLNFARLTANNQGGTVIIGQGADGWALSLVEVTSQNASVNAPMRIHTGSVDVADRVLLDRVYIHPQTAQMHVIRCVIGNASNLTIRYSVLVECHNPNSQAQGIAFWNTPGPIHIHDNYINAASQGVLSGGSATNHHPSDVTIRRNHFYTPGSWQGRYHNLAQIETKDIKRVLIEGNVLDGGEFSLLLKSSAQGGACSPASTCGTEHVTVRRNIIRNSKGGINTARAPVPAAGQGGGFAMHDVLIEDNVFSQIGPDSQGWTGGEGRLFQVLEAPHNLTMRNVTFNTGGHTYLMMGHNGSPVNPLGTRFVLENIVVTGPLRYRALISSPTGIQNHYATWTIGTIYGDCANPPGGGTCVSSIPANAGANQAAVNSATSGVVR